MKVRFIVQFHNFDEGDEKDVYYEHVTELSFVPTVGMSISLPNLYYDVKAVSYDTQNDCFDMRTDRKEYDERRNMMDEVCRLKKVGWKKALYL